MASNALTAPSLPRLFDASMQLILELQTPEGAYPASPTFSAYTGYCWFRDGAFIADAVSAAGGIQSASAFFDWCARVLSSRAEQIEAIVRESQAGNPPLNERMLPARFTFAGGDGNDDWWDFQLDGYGTWLWALVAHGDRHGLGLERWQHGVELTVDYLLSSWARPCYDWWEENQEHIHVSTLGCVAAGLAAVAGRGMLDGARRVAAENAVDQIHALIAERGTRDGHLIKWLDGDTVDGSLAAVLAPLGFAVSAEVISKTIDAIENGLTVDDGVHRYREDTFFGGGQWPLLSCFLGLAQSVAGRNDRARELLTWAASTATDRLELPEQVSRHLLAPGMRQEWVDRWGPVATPLLWSHAMFIRLAVELGIEGQQKGTAR